VIFASEDIKITTNVISASTTTITTTTITITITIIIIILFIYKAILLQQGNISAHVLWQEPHTDYSYFKKRTLKLQLSPQNYIKEV
jgi:hypothetical protein